MNGSDCGMFTCKYADYITKDKPITFTQVTSNSISESIFSVSSHNEGLKMSLLFCFWQKHMPYFRKRILWEIVNHKLLWCEDDNCEVVQLPHILMMVEFYSPGKDSQMGDLNSGNNFHTSSSDQEPAQRFPSSAKSSWKDVAGATNHCLQLLLQFFFCVCVRQQLKRFDLYGPVRTVFEITLVQIILWGGMFITCFCATISCHWALID